MFFIADIMLTFRTTFFDQDNELVLDKKVIAQSYLHGAFPVRRGRSFSRRRHRSACPGPMLHPAFLCPGPVRHGAGDCSCHGGVERS
eukprot:57001-Prymnesium_polylepis.2